MKQNKFIVRNVNPYTEFNEWVEKAGGNFRVETNIRYYTFTAEPEEVSIDVTRQDFNKPFSVVMEKICSKLKYARRSK